MHPARAKYAELRHLLEAGVPLEDAMRRTGVRTAEAAHRWAVRNGDDWLRDRMAHASEVERWRKFKR